MFRNRILLGYCFLLVANSGYSADLRIETRVYATGDETLVNESVTLFRDGAVYDFRDSESRITIFRPGRSGAPGRFVLFDTQREIRTEISTDKIDRAMDKLRKWSASQEDPFLRFTGAPVFKESFNSESGELRLEGDQLSYRLVTLPLEQPDFKLELRTFLDHFAKLHALIEAGLSPEPRLRVNEALFRFGVLPVEVELTARDDEEPSLRAEHLVVWLLSKPDLGRIDRAMDHLASYHKVSNAEYQAGRRRGGALQATQTVAADQ